MLASRSTLPMAAACRNFMNFNLSKLDEADQRRLVQRLAIDWEAAFFELVVARIMQALGASVVLDVANADGKRPDVAASFPDGLIMVEATVPAIGADIDLEEARRAPLLDFIESCTPRGWDVGVSEVPSLAPDDSRQTFMREIRQMLDVDPPTRGEQPRTLVRSTSRGDIRLTLVPGRSAGTQQLLWETGYGYCDDTATRVLRAVRRKRRQVRASHAPVLLAVNAKGLSSRLHAFDSALFGATWSHEDITGRVTHTSFRASGEFSRIRDKSPTYAGLLAFTGVGLAHCRGPVLYVHPRFGESLPSGFDRIERRLLSRDRDGIMILPAEGPDPSIDLGLVDPSRFEDA